MTPWCAGPTRREGDSVALRVGPVPHAVRENCGSPFVSRKSLLLPGLSPDGPVGVDAWA